MKTSRVVRVFENGARWGSALALVLAAASATGACASEDGSAASDGSSGDESVAADEDVGEASEALSVCGAKPSLPPCKFATCQNKHWVVKNKANGTVCNDASGPGTCSAGKCD